MAAKGTIKQDILPANKYILTVVGLPPLTVTDISGIEQELETVTLPDRTVVSGGNKKAFEIEIKMPAHHRVEQAAMQQWARDSEDPVAPDYKKTVTITSPSNTGLAVRFRTLKGVFPKKMAETDRKMESEGELVMVTWTLSVDDTDVF